MKIAYRSASETEFAEKHTFSLSEVGVSETDEENVFTLSTPHRIYYLRSPSNQAMKEWMRAITQCQKHHLRKQRKELSPRSPRPHLNYKNPVSLMDTTIPHSSLGVSPEKNPTSLEKVRELNCSRASHNSNLNKSHRSNNMFSAIKEVPEEWKMDLSEFTKKMSAGQAEFHVFTIKLRARGPSDFLSLSKKSEHHYILFSSKSLFPEEYIGEENLSSSHLPHWAEIDTFYQLSGHKHEHKLVFSLATVSQLKESEEYCSLEIASGSFSGEFVCESLEERKSFKETLETAIVNAKEARVKGVLYRKNFDRLVQLHSTNIDDFNESVLQMFGEMFPQGGHSFEPEVFIKMLEGTIPALEEVVLVLENKVSPAKGAIGDLLRLVNEEVKMYLKLTWSSSFELMKGIDMLNILKSLARYEEVIQAYINDIELLHAMKELSKIYTRSTYKNF